MIRLGFFSSKIPRHLNVATKTVTVQQQQQQQQQQRRALTRHDNDLTTNVATAVLLRHGQSTWNAHPTFTGWCNPPLTTRGEKEAVEAGQLLHDRGFTHFDGAFTSNLSRAVNTCELTLQAATGSLATTPLIQAHELNERHYGILQGKPKNCPELEQLYGKEQLVQWRRHFKARPPPMDQHHEHYQPPPAPVTESLQDCQERVVHYWTQTIVPTLQPSKTILIAAHSNTIRALVAHLDQVPEDRVPNIRIPNSVPCVYRFSPDGSPVLRQLQNAAGATRGHWLFSAENQERLRKNLGLTTGSFVQSIFDAWDTNGDGVLSLEEIKHGLRQVRRKEGENLAMSFLAAKILQDMELNGTVKCQYRYNHNILVPRTLSRNDTGRVRKVHVRTVVRTSDRKREALSK